MNESSKMRELFLEMFPNMAQLVSEHDSSIQSYETRSYFSDTFVSKSGSFEQFINELFNIASNRAPDTIKQFFAKKPSIVLDIDKDGYVFYPLAVGVFKDVTYEVRATSLHKYEKHHYLVHKI